MVTEQIGAFSRPVVTPRTAGAQAAASALAFTAAEDIDNGAYDIQMDVHVTGSTGAVTVTASWDGVAADPVQPGSDGSVIVGHTFDKLGPHTLTIVVTDQTASVSKSTTVTPAGLDYTAYGPTRLLDTRSSRTTLKPGADVRVKIAGSGGISAKALSAVLNITVTNPTAGGYVSAYPDGAPTGTSNVNFTAGQTVPNLAIASVGDDGYVALHNGSKGTIDLIVDIDGYFSRTPASGYSSSAPSRLVDTRKGIGAAKTPVAAGASIAVQIAGQDGIPATGVTAVALNVTATGGKSNGYLAAYPDGAKQPTVSNVNYGAGQSIANAVVVPVGADGKIRLANGPGSGVDAVIDVSGYYSAGSAGAYMPVFPTRVADTRTDGTGSVAPHDAHGYGFPGTGVEAPAAAVINVTVPVATSPGYISVVPNNGTTPNVSSLNFQKNQTVANLVQATLDDQANIAVWNMATTPNNLVIDYFGYYLNH
ncbi:hypothetical protein ABUW04_13035 [Streptacidiphilus sp. N1-10]|uniref:PKD domain-containing protein n=1 Tax=Streptacidiphilus jeojiensis TaxID=3229225 RepID=A0ABV6XM92_9ACTN